MEKAQDLSLELINQIIKDLKTDNPEIQSIVNALPFFKKDIARFVVQPKLDMDSNFKVIDEFDDEKYHITLLRVLHRINHLYCIKKIKLMSYPKHAEFLGDNGLNYLKMRYPEKIRGEKVYSFASKRSIYAESIPGIFTGSSGRFEPTFLQMDNSVMGKDNIIAVFREL